jgi:hypothetical protein
MKPTPQDLFWWAMVGGLGAFGLTTILRSTPGIAGLVRQGKKPWACNVCMPLYTAAAMTAVPIWWTGDWSYAVAYPGAYAVGYMALDRATRPPPGRPKFPELTE